MLQSLRIRNLAIVEDLRVEFGPGLNVITGETGAGKSVMIGALNLLLGARADKTLIRAGADQCAVEAVFQLPATTALTPLLDELGVAPCEDGCLIIRRQLGSNGTGKCLINDSPATVQALKQIGDLLVDMHGPHDHQSLLSREFQLDLLDAFGHLEKSRASYAAAYREWQDRQRARAALADESGDPAEQIARLQFQVQEIEAAGLTELDEPQLLQEHAAVANAKRILELAEGIDQALAEGETSVFNNLVHAQKLLQELSTIVPPAAGWKAEAAALAGQAGELAQVIVGFAQRIDAEPERLQALENRLAQLHQLKRKYGPAVADILATLEAARSRLTDLETRGERAALLDEQIKTAVKSVTEQGQELSQQRRAGAKKLATAVTKELRDLGFAHGAFAVTLTAATAPGPGGLDEIEFGFAPNMGEPIRPLRTIASSGEMSRVMLATKSVLAAHDRIPVLVFDEVDANVGGEMANAVGEKLRAVATGHQVLCITHLPQVAAQGARHYVVTKTVRDQRTLAAIQPVTDAARAEEVARMLGGRDLTSVTIRHARELLKKYALPAAKGK